MQQSGTSEALRSSLPPPDALTNFAGFLVLNQLDLYRRFDAEIAVPNINTQAELAHLLQYSGVFSESNQQRTIADIQEITGSKDVGVGIKKVLTAIKTAEEDQDVPGRFARIMSQAIAAKRNLDP